jgi:FlaA1/EpsC-like NDP-sugar epimerase
MRQLSDSSNSRGADTVLNMAMKHNWRTLLAFVHDLTACAAAWFVAFWLRFNFEIPDPYTALAMETLPWVIVIYAAIFVSFGLYRGIWRFASLPDLRRIIIAVCTAALAVPLALLILGMAPPRSVFIITPVFLIMAMGGSRFVYRAWRERHLAPPISEERKPVLIMGAEDSAVNLLKELARSPQWHVVGVLSEDQSKHGREIHGIKILGALDDIGARAKSLAVEHAIIAMPQATHTQRRHAVDLCTNAGLKVLTVPSYDDLLTGKVTISQIRHVELDDLLGRNPVTLDTVGLKTWITGRTVMITGAGGSIGSELCRQLARLSPSQLVLFELNEFALYVIEQEFASEHPQIQLVCAIGDIKDAARVSQIMEAYQPTVIFHAAAYKHVPLMESDNAWQAVLNNVRGTEVLAHAAMAHDVEKFVLISTDKAVNPTNVMGATKRLAEMLCQSLQRAQGTRFVMVRFGNVLGSTGSVIPKFREQIAKGGPVTVTHPEITRYFMSIPEAVQLVLQAGLMGTGGEIFVLDMGEPVRIADLARDMIRLSGFLENDIRIVYSGLRPGEKLYEEVLAADESTLPTPHPKLRIARARMEDGDWSERFAIWLDPSRAPDSATVKAELQKWVPEYQPR